MSAEKLLPTPTAQAAKHGSTPDVNANGYGYNLWDIPHLLKDSTSSQAAPPVSPSQPPADGEATPTTATSGPSSPVPFAHFSPVPCSSRTCPESCHWLSLQGSLFSDVCWPTWPKQGMWDSGYAYGLPMLELRTGGNGFLFLPTPTGDD